MFDFTTESRCLQSKALNLGKMLSWLLAMLLGLIYGNNAQMSRFNSDLVDRAQIDDYINLQTTAAEREYDDDYVDDYVEYDEEIRVGTKSADISADLDMMLLEMDMESDDLFGEDGDEDEDEDDSDDFGDEDSSEEEKLDIYEFDDVAPEIFRDPTLMVKWLNKQ